MEYEFLVEVGPAAELEDGKRTTPIYASKLSSGRMTTEYEGGRTLYELFTSASQKYMTRPLHGKRERFIEGKVGDYQWQTYGEVQEIVAALAKAVQAQGCRQDARIGVYGSNSPEWAQAMLSCFCFSAVCVPLYDTVAANAVQYVISHAQVEWIYVAQKNCEKLKQVIESIGLEAKQIRGICIWQDLSNTEQSVITTATQVFADAGIYVVTWEDFIQQGKARYTSHVPFPTPPNNPESTAVLMYTSGTMDVPKGVVLSHRAITSAVVSTFIFADKMGLRPENGVHLSWLTLAHIYGFVMEIVTIVGGGKIGYWQGTTKKLPDDIATLRPSALFGVPRVWETIVDKANSRIADLGSVPKWIFDTAFAYKKNLLEQGSTGDMLTYLIDRFLFSRIRQSMGGEVLYIGSGAAPLPRHLEEFLRIALPVPLIQGYGLTETCAVTCFAIPDRYDLFGTVGAINACAEFRLESVPELGYDVAGNPPAGEICFRGACLFSEYYKNAKEYDKAVDRDGFFHTGDIAELHPTGALKIIDRKKNIFKLSQGEYVAVEKIESTLQKASSVAQIWVYGSSWQRYLVAIVFPHWSRLCQHIERELSIEELCRSAVAKGAVLNQLAQVGREAGFKGFEHVRNIALVPEEFSVENGLLTPSQKLKRHVLLRRYTATIEALYGEIDQN